MSALKKNNTHIKSDNGFGEKDIKKKAFFGVIWGSGKYLLHQIILLIVKLVLVRLLIPEEFGIASMAAIVISTIEILGSFGTTSAFVRDNKSDPVKAKNTLFYIEGTFSTVIMVVGLIIAPYVASFFEGRFSNTESLGTLTLIIQVLALGKIVDIFTTVPSTILGKNLRFKEGVIAGIAGTIAYGISACLLAYYGFGPWSIILSQLFSSIVSGIILFCYSPFIPSLIFDMQIAKQYLGFGKHSFINSLVDVIISNGDNTIVGRLLGSAAIGFYSLAEHFSSIVYTVISGVINNVMFPVFSRIQDDKEMFSKAFYKAFRLMNVLTVPAIGGSVVLSYDIVNIIFGEKWLPMVPIFQILSLSIFFGNIITLAGPVLNSANKPHLIKNKTLIQLAMYALLIYPFAKFWGNEGVSWVMVGFSVVSVTYLAPHLAKEVEHYYKYLFEVLSKVVPCTLVMMLIVYLLKPLVHMNLIWLFSLVGIGIIVYFIPMWFLDKDLKWDIKEGWIAIKEKFATK